MHDFQQIQAKYNPFLLRSNVLFQEEILQVQSRPKANPKSLN